MEGAAVLLHQARRRDRSGAARGRTLRYPMATKNFHFELELVVAIGHPACSLPPDQAEDFVFGYAVGLDMTRRDLQNDMREKKRPWDIGKSFAQAAPIAPLHPAPPACFARGDLLDVNGTRSSKAISRHDLGRAAYAAFLSKFTSCCRATSCSRARRRASVPS